MIRLVAPLDFNVPVTTAEYIYNKFGLPAVEIFKIAVDVWHLLENPNEDFGCDDLVEILMERYPHLEQYGYPGFMDLAWESLKLIYRFRDALNETICNRREEDIDYNNQLLTFEKWLPNAVVVHLH